MRPGTLYSSYNPRKLFTDSQILAHKSPSYKINQIWLCDFSDIHCAISPGQPNFITYCVLNLYQQPWATVTFCPRSGPSQETSSLFLWNARFIGKRKPWMNPEKRRNGEIFTTSSDVRSKLLACRSAPSSFQRGIFDPFWLTPGTYNENTKRSHASWFSVYIPEKYHVTVCMTLSHFSNVVLRTNEICCDGFQWFR